jgi:delta-aminolevulinic acid dehydratase/porphobilinogen synthase
MKMSFPDQRMRRLRKTDAWRRMVRETTLTADDFVLSTVRRAG